MFQICCSAKLIAELGLKPGDLPYSSPATPLFKVWYADVYRYERRKCIALLNPSTSYTLFALNVVKKEILRLPALMKELLDENLRADGVSEGFIKDLLNDSEFEFCRTDDRSARAMLSRVVRESSFFASTLQDQREINQKLSTVFNRRPFLDGRFPLQELGSLIGEKLEDKFPKLYGGGEYDGPILQIKISLVGANPGIWRTFRVPSSLDLHRFHLAIQGAMGWEDCHLHSFSSEDRVFEDLRADPESEGEDERKASVGELFGNGSSARYNYDFGEDWLHELLIENSDMGPEDRLPRCVDGAGTCPPENCGGIPGFEELITVLQGPPTARRAELIDWLGGEYDPDDFSVEEANLRMRKTAYGF